MAANRTQTMGNAFRTIWSRGGISGLYQGLIPWVSALSNLAVVTRDSGFVRHPSGLVEVRARAPELTSLHARSFGLVARQAWIEASSKGAVLIFASSEIESATSGLGLDPAVSGLLGGMGGGIAQAYATMGEHNPFPQP